MNHYKIARYIVNKTINGIIIISFLTLAACNHKELENSPLVIDFEISQGSNTVPTELIITNNTIGATSYSWKFHGGDPVYSSDKNPNKILYNKAGKFYIELTASNNLETKSQSKEIIISTNEIITFKNIKLGGFGIKDSIATFFSTCTGKAFKDADITDENGSTIDIAYVGIAVARLFESPDSICYWGFNSIPGATTTKFINMMADNPQSFTVETFDKMIDDSPLSQLKIKNDFQSLPLGEVPFIVLFENAKGKKGAIKVTEMESSQKDGIITFDLKVQK